jgi:nitrous-oxide reductase
MLKKYISPAICGILSGLLAATLSFADFGGSSAPGTASASDAINAQASYVPFGQKDSYYLFASGGHSGQLYVYGIPSMRKIRTIPVFSPDTASGYGFDDKTKKMLGGYTWGDLHHPAFSETNGEYNGKYVFASDVANNRIAVVDLKTFTTEDILQTPNTVGPHCAAFVTQNSEYVFLPTRFSAPVGQQYAPLDDFDSKYKGVMSAIQFNEQTKKLELAYQVALPPWSYDLSDAGKKESGDWAVLTTYNTEEATTNLEISASQKDRDYIVLFNWKELAQDVKEGKYDMVDGVKMIDPAKLQSGIYLVPVAKSPHGVDVSPDGKYFIASGKLAPAMTVFSFAKAFDAIKNQKFTGKDHGIPVLDYNSVMEREVNPENALGPLHTMFDDQGNAYTAMFISSEIVKWNIATGETLDRIPVQYAPGHLATAEGDSVSPDGKWLVSLNKLSKDNFLSVGPSHPETLQLIDLSGSKMKLVQTVPSDPEPHYAQIIKADKIKNPINVYPKDPNNQDAVWDTNSPHIERHGNEVDVYGVALRSKFIMDAKSKRPDLIQVKQGDKVVIHLTNIDLDEDITHGFGINNYDINMEVQPGETKTVTFIADKPGTFPFYCTNFCSALHQEMSGYLLVEPKS